MLFQCLAEDLLTNRVGESGLRLIVEKDDVLDVLMGSRRVGKLKKHFGESVYFFSGR